MSSLIFRTFYCDKLNKCSSCATTFWHSLRDTYRISLRVPPPISLYGIEFIQQNLLLGLRERKKISSFFNRLIFTFFSHIVCVYKKKGIEIEYFFLLLLRKVCYAVVIC